jgi:hypothetical protein
MAQAVYGSKMGVGDMAGIPPGGAQIKSVLSPFNCAVRRAEGLPVKGLAK